MSDSTRQFERDRLFKKWGQFKPLNNKALTNTILSDASKRSLPELDSLTLNFFEETKKFFENPSKHSAKGIAKFLHEISDAANAKSLLKKKIWDLQQLINTALLETTEEKTLSDLNEIFNSLAKIGFTKEDLAELKIKELGGVFNEAINQANHFELANGVNGFARLGFENSEVKLNLGTLLQRTRQIVGRFNDLDVLSFLHGLAQLKTSEPSEAKMVAQKLLWQGQESGLLNRIDHRGFATLVHSLAKMEMFEELSAVQSWANNFVANQENLQGISAESAHSLLYAQDLCCWIGKFDLFSEAAVETIKQKYSEKVVPTKLTVSNLQQSVADSLPQRLVEQEHRPLESKNFTRYFDISYSFEDLTQSKTKLYLIEVDGPNHFYKETDLVEQKPIYKTNSATRQRDKINLAIAHELARNPNLEVYYLTLPFWKLEERQNLSDYVHQMVDNAIKIESQDVVNEKEIALILPTEEEEKSEELALKEEARENNKPEEARQKPAKNEFVKIPVQAATTEVSTQESEGGKLERNKKIFGLLSKAKDIHSLILTLKEKDPLFDAKIILEEAIKADNPRFSILCLVGNKVVELKDPQLSPQELIKKGAFKTLSAVISAGAEVNSRLDNGQSLLAFLVTQPNPNLAVVNSLISAGADVNSRLENGQSLLAFLVTQPNPNLDVVNSLISAGAEVNFQEAAPKLFGQILIRAVTKNPDLACQLLKFREIEITENEAKKIIKYATDQNLPELAEPIIERFKGGQILTNALERAANKCAQSPFDVAIFDALVRNGADLANLSLNPERFAMLSIACFSRASVETKLKLTASFKVEEVIVSHFSPFYSAAKAGETEVVREILKKMNCNKSSLDFPKIIGVALSCAALSGNKETVEVILPHANGTEQILNALSVAKNCADREIFDFLFSRLPSQDLLTRDKWKKITFLAVAVNSEKVSKIALANAQLESEDLKEVIYEVVSSTCSEGCEALRYLIKTAVNLGGNFAEIAESKKLLHWSAFFGDTDRLKVFKEFGVTNSRTNSPLASAISSYQVEVVRYLLEECKLDPNEAFIIQQRGEQRGIMLAIEKAVHSKDDIEFQKTKEVIALLVKNGADLNHTGQNANGSKDIVSALIYPLAILKFKMSARGSETYCDKLVKTAEVTELILSVGAKYGNEITDENLTLAAGFASECKIEPLVKLFSHYKAKISSQNEAFETPDQATGGGKLGLDYKPTSSPSGVKLETTSKSDCFEKTLSKVGTGSIKPI